VHDGQWIWCSKHLESTVASEVFEVPMRLQSLPFDRPLYGCLIRWESRVCERMGFGRRGGVRTRV
jgi:hypothetical protein